MDGTHVPDAHFNASHIIYCMGADLARLPPTPMSPRPAFSAKSADKPALCPPTRFHKSCVAPFPASYISPSWQGHHCYGATFVLDSNDETWYPNEEAENRATLHQLNPPLAQSLFEQDSFSDWPSRHTKAMPPYVATALDHLPSSALGDIATMQSTYQASIGQKLPTRQYPCPYLPNAYINTAARTGGSPLSAAADTSEILSLPHPLSQRLRTALPTPTAPSSARLFGSSRCYPLKDFVLTKKAV